MVPARTEEFRTVQRTPPATKKGVRRNGRELLQTDRVKGEIYNHHVQAHPTINQCTYKQKWMASLQLHIARLDPAHMAHQFVDEQTYDCRCNEIEQNDLQNKHATLHLATHSSIRSKRTD